MFFSEVNIYPAIVSLGQGLITWASWKVFSRGFRGHPQVGIIANLSARLPPFPKPSPLSTPQFSGFLHPVSGTSLGNNQVSILTTAFWQLANFTSLFFPPLPSYCSQQEVRVGKKL